MDDKIKDNAGTGDTAPGSRSAFPGARGSVRDQAPAEGSPIPSQPRSFVPLRSRPATPAGKPAEAAPAPPSAPAAPVEPAKPSAHDLSALRPTKPESRPSPAPAAPTAVPETGKFPTAPKATAKPAAAEKSATSSFPKAVATTAAAASATATARPQSSGAGGDTIPLRVKPRPQQPRFSTGATAGRGLRQRLPDIRRRSSGPAAAAPVRYGPFSLFFGFIWLIFKMIFFTLLVMGLAAAIGYGALMVYIRTPEVTVPSVAGMKINEAFEVLSDKKLGVRKVGEESSALVAPGEIISQQPPAGSTAKEGASVGLILSSGRSRFVVPNVVNESRENAINKIRGAGLEVGDILALEDANVPREHVISQTPIGGTGLDEPGKVQLMVSSGPPGLSLVMRDFTGRTIAEAKAALRVVGVTNIEVQPPNASDADVIKSQEPLVGKSIFQSDKVTLRTGESE